MRSPRLARAILLLGIGTSLAGSPAQGQRLRPATVDLTAGPATSWGGSSDYAFRRTASLTFSWVPERRGAALWGLTVGLRPQLASINDLVCTIQPDGSCRIVPEFPWLVPYGAFAGAQIDGPATEYRVTLGPMLYAGGISGWGGRAQLDLAAGSSTAKFVVAARADLLRHGAESVKLGSLEAGVRIF
ncbi:MAG TPA: hypothetical protein VF832_06585 [Longimicrobiales bacterium]